SPFDLLSLRMAFASCKRDIESILPVIRQEVPQSPASIHAQYDLGVEVVRIELNDQLATTPTGWKNGALCRHGYHPDDSRLPLLHRLSHGGVLCTEADATVQREVD